MRMGECSPLLDTVSSIPSPSPLARYTVLRFNRAIPDRSIHPRLASGSAITLLADDDPCTSCRSCSRRRGHTTVCRAHWKGFNHDHLPPALCTLSRPQLQDARELLRCRRVVTARSMLRVQSPSLAGMTLNLERDREGCSSSRTEHETTRSFTRSLLGPGLGSCFTNAMAGHILPLGATSATGHPRFSSSIRCFLRMYHFPSSGCISLNQLHLHTAVPILHASRQASALFYAVAYR